MAFGLNRVQSAEQDRQRALRQAQAQEDDSTSTDASASVSSARASSTPVDSTARTPAPARTSAPSGNTGGSFRPGARAGSFRPGSQNTRATTRGEDEAAHAPQGPNVSLAVEDGISSVQVIRRLLEVAAVRQWPQTQVSRLEALAHDDASAAWMKISNAWEELCDERRAKALHRDDAQIVFTIISDGVARESSPTGPRAKHMALLHGLSMVRLPVERSPFGSDVIASVAAEQRRLRQAAAGAQASETSPTQADAPASPDQPSEPVASTGRYNRFARR